MRSLEHGEHRRRAPRRVEFPAQGAGHEDDGAREAVRRLAARLQGRDVEARADGAVEAVLHVVVGAPRDAARDGAPLVAVRAVAGGDERVLAHRPRAFLQRRVQVVLPALARLLPAAPRDRLRDRAPVARTVPRHQPRQQRRLARAPGALEDFLHTPAVRLGVRLRLELCFRVVARLCAAGWRVARRERGRGAGRNC